MANKLTNDNSVINEGRKKVLRDVEVSLKEQVVEKLRLKLVDDNVGEKVADLWRLGNGDRTEFLERQRAFLLEFDEFIDPIYPSGTDWGSALHLPIALTHAKTFHARMLSALLGVDPPFTVQSRAAANSQRAPLVQDLMRYSILEWCNKGKGINEIADRWIWNWITQGTGLLKTRWHREYTRFMDVEKVPVQVGKDVVTDPQTGEKRVKPIIKMVEKEVEKTLKVFDCPAIERIAVEDLLIVGGDGDPQAADDVIQQLWMTASELWSAVDQKIFNGDAVHAVVKSGRNRKGAEPVSAIKQDRSAIAGESQLDKPYEIDKYQILEAYIKYDVDGSGITSDIIVWVHMQTREILRATYLRRAIPDGRRPFHKIDFHRREGATNGVGIIEMLYSLSKEIDAIHNIRIDVGIISSQPFGFYKPTASMTAEKLPMEPGMLLPLDNPQTDVYFPNLGNKYSFGFQEESSLMNMVERLTSINDISLGAIGGQGVTRTATGTRAIVQETNANLDVFIRRMNEGWRSVLLSTFAQVQQNVPAGFEYRLFGDDGQAYWSIVRSPEEIQGMFDFILEPNSAQSNKQMMVDTAQQVYQMTGNPIDLQLGIVTPVERYEALKNLLQQMGVKDFSRFVRKPEGGVKWTPEQLTNLILSGAEVKMDPTQDLQGFIDFVNHIFEHDELLGQFEKEQVMLLAKKMQEASGLLESLMNQKAQVANLQQQQMNSQQLTAPSQPAAPMSISGGGPQFDGSMQ